MHPLIVIRIPAPLISPCYYEKTARALHVRQKSKIETPRGTREIVYTIYTPLLKFVPLVFRNAEVSRGDHDFLMNCKRCITRGGDTIRHGGAAFYIRLAPLYKQGERESEFKRLAPPFRKICTTHVSLYIYIVLISPPIYSI